MLNLNNKMKSAYGTCLEEQNEALNQRCNLFVNESEMFVSFTPVSIGPCIYQYPSRDLQKLQLEG